MNTASKITSGYLDRVSGTRPFPRGLQDERSPRLFPRRGGLSSWLLVLPGTLLLGLFAIPILSLALRSMDGDFLQNLASEGTLSALRLSLLTSTLTVLIAVAAGIPLAYALARWKFPFKPILELLIDLPIVLPPSVAGIALLTAFGRRGLLGPLLGSLGLNVPFTTAAVVIAQVFVAAPLYVRAARIGFAEIDIQIEEAARVEGANPWQLFWHVMVPLAGRALLSGAVLTWTRALGEFGATMLFAGNLPGVTRTMPMAIYMGFEHGVGNAIALSMLLIALSVILLGLTRSLERHRT